MESIVLRKTLKEASGECEGTKRVYELELWIGAHTHGTRM